MYAFCSAPLGFQLRRHLQCRPHVQRRRRLGRIAMVQELGPRLGQGGSAGNAQSSGKAEALERWLEDNGMYLSKLATWGRAKHPLGIANETTDEGEPSGRGLVAVKPILQGELLFEVPEKCLMTKERAIEEVQGLPSDVDDYAAIAVLLIQERERGERSFWKPYIGILPTASELIPLFTWPEDELRLLEGSPTVAAAKSLKAKVQTDYNALEERLFSKNRECFPENVFTLAAWQWAFSILFTRAVMLSAEKLIALVPYADLLNHNPFCSTYIDIGRDFFSGTRNAVLYTDRQYGKMDQVFTTYGPKSNADLLLLYGFVVERNPYDSVDVTVSLQKDDPLWERKRQYLEASGVKPVTKFPLYRDRYPVELIEFLRFCVADEKEMDTADFGQYINEANETLVAKALIEACRDAIASYPQTIEDDEKLMADRALYQTLEQKHRWAIRQRLSEKRILRRTMVNIEREIVEPSFSFTQRSER